MIQRSTTFWMLLAISAGIGLFLLKYEVKSMEGKLVTVHSKTLSNLEETHVLKAEWSYLNQPSRLENLGRRLLHLHPARAVQSTSIENIPLRPVTQTKVIDPPAADQVPPHFAKIRRKQ